MVEAVEFANHSKWRIVRRRCHSQSLKCDEEMPEDRQQTDITLHDNGDLHVSEEKTEKLRSSRGSPVPARRSGRICDTMSNHSWSAVKLRNRYPRA